MDKKCFVSEMHQYIDTQYEKFQQYQNDVIASLKEFDKVCRNNSITYYLGFGALLGYYRDGELLPWDYDIDVVVPIIFKERLIEALKKELNEDFYFYCPEVDSKCRHYCIRITKKGFDSAAVHLDVFYLIGAPDDLQRREKFRKEIKFVNFARKEKLQDDEAESLGKKTSKSRAKLKRLYLGLKCPIWLLNQKHNNLCSQVLYEKANYVSTMQAAADTYTKDIFGIPSEIDVDGSKIYAPTDVIGFFNQTYKNYKAYPQISSRFDEFYNSMKRLEYYETRTKAISKNDYQINTY